MTVQFLQPNPHITPNRDKIMLRYLPFLMLIVPITEIAVFIVVGQWIGVVPTIALVILTAITGAGLLRHQGLGLAMKIRGEVEAGRVPGRDLANGAMMLVAGVLLLTPGFVTDTLGFLLFIPQIRSYVFAFLAKRVKFITPHGTQNQSYGGDTRHGTIDLESDDYTSEDATDKKPADPASPWNKND
jgi:UPF0716 protein FxsA